jgi:hypothetical protein
MYQLIKLLSYLARQFLLPNPFINLVKDAGTAEIINWIFGGILVLLAYNLTGTWYRSQKGNNWVGSLGFLINYIVLTFHLIGISYLISNIYLVVGIFIIVYILLCIIESKILGSKDILL